MQDTENGAPSGAVAAFYGGQAFVRRALFAFMHLRCSIDDLPDPIGTGRLSIDDAVLPFEIEVERYFDSLIRMESCISYMEELLCSWSGRIRVSPLRSPCLTRDIWANR